MNCSTTVRGLLACWRFPKLNFVTLGVDHPAKLALFRGLGLVDDVAPFRAQRREQCVQIRHAEVDHEGRGARLHVICVLGKWAPNGHARRALRAAPRKDGAAPVGHVQAQVVALRHAKALGVGRCEADAANAGHALHRLAPPNRRVRVLRSTAALSRNA